MTATGYMHPAYAASLAEFGAPRLLPRSGGWVLERGIEGFPDRDAVGCYPLFSCPDWARLRADLDDLGGQLVSLALVTDPFGDYDAEYLKECFREVAVPFKQHFVVDLSREPAEFVHAHHRRNARRAAREVRVEECAPAADFLDEWDALYKVLVARHGISGAAAFSKESFAGQLRVPGVAAFRAERDGATVGMLLWYVQGDVAYYHLGAYSERGYELRASFALFHHAIEHFARRGLRWLNLGGAAGASAGGAAGLERFKEGWASGTRTAYFCGRIFDRGRYEEIVRAKGVPATSYFPAYRLGEFR
ncbi:MAG: GNAT family N-acetyltransferase [Acidobacteriota bacterium]|nr:GNAT family N-acetyltransferase [Acidobacteriota bacterium]